MFEDRLRAVRIYRGYKLQYMADNIGRFLHSYQKYESGDTRPTYESLIVIADILDVPIDFLLGRDGYLQSLGVRVDVPLEAPPRRGRKKKKSNVKRTTK